ncbi:hypothetical protein [Micromonospora aurantiaca (nom. illeg.)]|uniref:hypothetical protein n=1 Tax=Micromonospora aurantiaca (nom. illeg.) TaxID=47850 RepID=UPI00379A2BC5
MSTLPFTLPTCGQPATVRLEVFTNTTAGLPDSLDASVYTCEQHADPATDTIEGTNRTANRVRMAPDVQRTCGQVYAFPTGQLADHPAWCDGKACGDRGEHRSVPMGVRPGPDDVSGLTAHLVQPVDSPTVLVALTFVGVDPADTAVQLVALDQAVILTYRIRTLAERAKGGRR